MVRENLHRRNRIIYRMKMNPSHADFPKGLQPQEMLERYMNKPFISLLILILFTCSCMEQKPIISSPQEDINSFKSHPYIIDDTIVAHSYWKNDEINILPAEKLNQVNWNMNLKDIVIILGPGFIHTTEGIGYVRWFFDNNKSLTILAFKLDERPKEFIIKTIK